MKNIKGIITSLETEQLRKFNLFISKRYQVDNRKDILLLNLIRKHKDWGIENFCFSLYGNNDSSSKHAYSQLKGSLRLQLEQFLLMDELQKNKKNQSWSLVATAKFLLKNNKMDLALYYLYKAEKNAKRYKNYQLLNTIYEILLENQSVFSHKTEQIISLKNKNLELFLRETNIISANAQVNYQIKFAYLNNKKINVLDILVSIYKKFGIDIFTEENKLFKLQAIRHAGLTMFDADHFEETIVYLEKEMQTLENELDNRETTLIYKTHFLHLILLCYFKLKKYKNCENILREVFTVLEKNSGVINKVSVIQFITLKGDLYFTLGNIDKSNYTLLDGFSYKLGNRDECLININLVGQYFAYNKLNEASSVLDKLNFKEHTFLNYFGELMVFKKYVEEIIIAFDQNERFDYIKHLIAALKRKFKQYITNSENKRDYLFIRLLEQLNKNRDLVFDKSFQIKVNRFIDMEDIDPLGPEVISYNAWLQAKINKKDYYKTYLEMIV